MAPPSPFTTITIEGGLLSTDLLARLVRQPTSVSGTSPDDYHLAPDRRLRDAINRSWSELQGAWSTFAAELTRRPAGEPTASVTRDRWLLPLFAELGFGRVQRTSALSVDGRDYPISHLWGAVPIHLLGADVDLDRRTRGVAGAASAAPLSMVQGLLNRSEDYLWAILSNGRRLRLLRDNTSLTRAAYVEFDLEAMFSGQVFTDFAVLWMACHESRFEADQPAHCWLERWIDEARQQGVRALDRLRTGFERAVTVLGGGFLAHPANTALRDRLRHGKLATEDYHRQVLRLVYRLVFLLVAEDRDLFHPPEATGEARRRYASYYSLGRIRDHARRHRGSRHADLFASLRPIFDACGADGIPAIGVPALGSFLWSPGACPDIDAAAISNSDLLEAIRHLAYTAHERSLQRVDFANLGPEELGSVYESLLELHPRLELDAGCFELVSAAGSERKSTGSYYTPTALISALLDLALDPILDEAESASDPAAAVLEIKVLDPACGSGHFLTAAARRIAARLAAVQTGELNPTPDAVRHALRQVVGSCIYGVDINPMAVELAKVNLWLDAVDPGLPLRFLDHHLVCGNGLVGANPRLIADGVPDGAFRPIEGDDRPTAAAHRRTNAAERRQRNRGLLPLGDSALAAAQRLAKAVQVLGGEDDTTAEALRAKQWHWEALQSSPEARLAKLAADTWCAAFFAPKIPGVPAITDQTLRALAADRTDDHLTIALVIGLAEHYRFLHPHLAFPDVFSAHPEADNGWRGGFDLVIGNPPWDALSPDRKEFFSSFEPKIRFAPKAEQDTIVAELLADPEIADRWDAYQRDIYASVQFMKASGRYRLFAPGNLGKGDFNVYRMFVETALQLTRPGGRAAQIVPAGFYGGANAAAVRLELFERSTLSHVLGFINTNDSWFPGVAAGTRFAAYVARRSGTTTNISVAFELRSTPDLARALSGDMTTLTVASIREQSPDSLAIPEVTNATDAALAARMYSAWPLFGDETAGPPVRHYQAELHMGNDRELFGDYLDGLPVYEGRMVDQFDHRAKAYRSGRGRSAVWEPLPFGSPGKAIISQWRLAPDRIPVRLGDRVWRYRSTWCSVTAPSNERTLVAALIPPGVICGHSLPTVTFPVGYDWVHLLMLSVFNSYCADYLVRKRVALNLVMGIIDSLPFPRLSIDNPIVQRLGPLALRLTCTSPEMTAYWNAMADHGWCERVAEGAPPPGLNDAEQRVAARAEIDAIVARELFELGPAELAAILNTFPVLRRREVKLYGEFRTKRLVLEHYESLTNAPKADSFFETTLHGLAAHALDHSHG